MTAADEGFADFLSRLQREAGGDGPRSVPPVHLWNPERCTGEGFDVLADGTWLHEGVRITREPLVRLFASILRRDPDGFYLVTPGEKVKVAVADAPFLGIRADRDGRGRDQTLAITTNMGDVVAIGPEHPLRVTLSAPGEEPRPYVDVRRGLEARILRAPFYEIVDWGETHDGRFGVWSGGAFWPIG